MRDRTESRGFTMPKKKYVKPKILHRDKVEVLAAACDSTWIAGRQCMIEGQSGCAKTRF